MKLRWALCLAILSVPVSSATTIDVSTENSAVVRTGDTLVFHLLTSSFGVNAAKFGLPLDPTEVNFALVSAPLSEEGEFAATLESADRSVSVPFGSLTFSPGYFEGSGYTGEVSMLQGYLHLTPRLSEGLFRGGPAVIALRNQGPDVEPGLAPYVLRQDLLATLSGGPLSVGARSGWVELESQADPAGVMSFGRAASFAAGAEVPEPRSGGLLLGGGVLLCGLSAVLARASCGRGEPLPREKSTICIR